MGVLPDWMIREQVRIEPKEDGVKRPNTISYGLSSYGYDIRAGYNWKVFTNVWGSVVDPKHFDTKSFVDVDATPQHEWDSTSHVFPECIYCSRYSSPDTPRCTRESPVLIPPNSFALTESMETLEVPRDCLALVIGKSTYARCGIVLNCTPLEPEWRGKVTLEVSNTTPLPARVYAGEGIGQVLFFRRDGGRSCDVSYADKAGKYQDQKGLELPRVD